MPRYRPRFSSQKQFTGNEIFLQRCIFRGIQHWRWVATYSISYGSDSSSMHPCFSSSTIFVTRPWMVPGLREQLTSLSKPCRLYTWYRSNMYRGIAETSLLNTERRSSVLASGKHSPDRPKRIKLELESRETAPSHFLRQWCGSSMWQNAYLLLRRQHHLTIDNRSTWIYCQKVWFPRS